MAKTATLKYFKNERGEVTLTVDGLAKWYTVTAIVDGKQTVEPHLKKRPAENLYWKYWYKFNEKH